MQPPPKDFLKTLVEEPHWIGGFSLDHISGWLHDEEFRIHERRGSYWFYGVLCVGAFVFLVYRLATSVEYQLATFLFCLVSVVACVVFVTLALADRRRLQEIAAALAVVGEAREKRERREEREWDDVISRAANPPSADSP